MNGCTPEEHELDIIISNVSSLFVTMSFMIWQKKSNSKF